jgi:hypothetical protein
LAEGELLSCHSSLIIHLTTIETLGQTVRTDM